jgi:hypothetical protein
MVDGESVEMNMQVNGAAQPGGVYQRHTVKRLVGGQLAANVRWTLQ